MRRLIEKKEIGGYISGMSSSSILKEKNKLAPPKGIGVQSGFNSKNTSTTSGSGAMGALNYLGDAGALIGKLGSIRSSNLESRSKTEAMVDTGIDASADAALKSGNPYAMAAGAIVKGVGMGAKSLIKVPKALRDFRVDESVQQSTGFGGTSAEASRVAKRAGEMKGASYSRIGWGFGGARKDVEAAKEAAAKQNKAAMILDKASTVNKNALSNIDFLGSNVNLQNTGYNLKNVTFGQKGMKIKAFKDGGKMNVIVNGKLHKELHNVKSNSDYKDVELTRKGIPVIMEDGGEIKQCAEIESDELIITLDLTKKLEGLKELGDEEAQIKAGKLLSYEIMKNTKDSKNKIIKNA